MVESQSVDLPVVLVVDDEVVLVTVLGRLLRSPSYEVLVVTTAAEARVVAQQVGERLRLLITDQNLMDGTGVGLADDLRVVRELPVVLLTGDQFLEHETYEVFPKPFEVDDLRALVHRKLGLV